MPKTKRMWMLDESLKKLGTKKGCAIFETFSTDGPSAFLVVRRSPWHKDQKRLNAPWRQNSSAASSGERQWKEGLEGKRVGWTPSERRVLGAVENYLENCVHMKMDIVVMERGPSERRCRIKARLHPGTRKVRGSRWKTGAGGVSLSRRRPREC